MADYPAYRHEIRITANENLISRPRVRGPTTGMMGLATSEFYDFSKYW